MPLRRRAVTAAVYPRACGERIYVLKADIAKYGLSPRLQGTGQLGAVAGILHRFIPAPAGNGICSTGSRRPRSVYPRACGERLIGEFLLARRGGLSPRLRGTEVEPDDVSRQWRFIPAPAGNGVTLTTVSLYCPVYPRACGERLVLEWIANGGDGLSPRLRGTVKPVQPAKHKGRFIPAPAGNGRRSMQKRIHQPVYPRACGERIRHPSGETGTVGLSPRLRGTEYVYAYVCILCRFIPAPAGNGRPCRSWWRERAVYPRACGERRRKSVSVGSAAGLSPRLRGTGLVCSAGIRLSRFIPAPAGNGPKSARPTSKPAVYPRACGERWLIETSVLANTGLSPRLRGTACSRSAACRTRRFIPAPAGNGWQRHAGRCVRPVYPRACGERAPNIVEGGALIGLSPRLRGTDAFVIVEKPGARFIPAPAGNGATAL